MLPAVVARLRSRAAAVLGVVLALLVGLLGWGAGVHHAGPATALGPADEAGQGARTTTNAVVFVVDDMDDFSCADTAAFLPRSSAWLREQGTCFENASVTSPVCCPARGQLVTGQMPHNNGVERQVDARLLRVEDTIQHDLGELGVATYGAGKYLNGVDAADYRKDFDTGFADFDFWNGMDFYHYALVDEEGNEELPRDGVHGTVRVGDYVDSFVAEQADAGEPFFAYAAFHAPHTQNAKSEPTFRELIPEPTPANAGRAVPPFDFRPERETSDKLPFFGNRRFTERHYRTFWNARVRSLYDIDDQMARIFTTMQDKGVLDDTAVFFVSDNGFLLGENGWEGKAVPYAGSVEVPMLAYYPGSFAAGAVDEREVGLVDIAPTLHDIFAITPDHVVDGQSLLTPFQRRVEYHEYRNERSRFVLRESGHAPMAVPNWRSVRLGDRTFIEYFDHHGRVLQREFYTDRAQRRNLLDPAHRADRPAAGTVRWFRRQAARLATCAGTPASGAPRPCP